MRTDILIDDDFDVLVANGDFVAGQSDEQHVALLALLNKGELRGSPITGLGIERFMKSIANEKKFIRDMKIELEGDGYENSELQISDDLSDFKVVLNDS